MRAPRPVLSSSSRFVGLHAVFLVGGLALVGCAHATASPVKAPPLGAASTNLPPHSPPVSAPALPKVVARILAEQMELVRSSQSMASELPDPRGRERALAETNQLATELARTATSIGRGDVDSDALDAAVNDLLLLDTRITLLHAKLRTATARTTAVLAE